MADPPSSASNPSGQPESDQSTVESLRKEIENLREGLTQFRRTIMVLCQSGMATLGLQYVDVGLDYLDTALVRRLQIETLGYHEPVRKILSSGLKKALETHDKALLKYVADGDVLASSDGRRNVRERYASYFTVNDKERLICAGLFDFFVGLSQFQPALATMPFVSDHHDFEKIRAGVKEVRDYIKDGHQGPEQKEQKDGRQGSKQSQDHLAQLVYRLHVLADRLKNFAKHEIIETKKRVEEEELRKVTQDGVLIALMAGVAAQSVAFVLPVSSTQPDLDTAASMLLLSAIVFGVSGVLAQASAYRRLTSVTALPIHYMKLKPITAIAHKGQAFGWSYNLTVLFTVAGLNCFAWMKLHPAKAPEDYQPPLVIFVIFFIIVCIPALAAVLAFVIRYIWHRYEVNHSDSERMGFVQYAKAAGEVDVGFCRETQIHKAQIRNDPTR